LDSSGNLPALDANALTNLPVPEFTEDTTANLNAKTVDGLYLNSETNQLFFRLSNTFYAFPRELVPFNPFDRPGCSGDETNPRITGWGSTISLSGSAGFMYETATGTRYQFVFSAFDAHEAFDVEGALDANDIIGLGATEQYSLISGNSDSGPGDSIVKNMQQAAGVGCSPVPILISAGGDTPSAKRYDRTNLRNLDFVGGIGEFILYATSGEDAFNNVAPTAILDANGDELDTGFTQDKKFTVVKDAWRVLESTNRYVGITSAANSTKIRFTVSGTDVTPNLAVGDIIQVYASDGVSCNGLHRITAISFSTDTIIDVNTDHQTGDATFGRLRACSRLEQYTTTTV
jgi:hypothetical protein